MWEKESCKLSSWILTIVQNYFIGQVNKSLVCTVSLEICKPLRNVLMLY